MLTVLETLYLLTVSNQLILTKLILLVIDVNGTRDTISVDRLKPAHIDKTNTTLPNCNDSTLTDSTNSNRATTPLPFSPPPPTPLVTTRSGRRVRFPARFDL